MISQHTQTKVSTSIHSQKGPRTCIKWYTLTNLLEDARSVDLVADEVDHAQTAGGERPQVAVLDQVRVVQVQVGEHRLRQRVALQPGHLSITAQLEKTGTKQTFHLTTHATHFIYGYMASNIW